MERGKEEKERKGKIRNKGRTVRQKIDFQLPVDLAKSEKQKKGRRQNKQRARKRE